MRVLVFPSCNEPGLEIVHALLKHPRVQVVGASSVDPRTDPSASILAEHATIPQLDNPHFEGAFDALCRDRSIDFIFASVDSVVATLAGRDLGDAILVGPSADAAAICASKIATYARLEGVVPLPRPVDDDDPLPCFAKPDRGGGGRGAARVDTPDELALARSRGLVVREYLPGAEFTVDCCGGPDGALLVASPRERVVVQRGIAVGTRSVDRPDLHAAVEKIARTLMIGGPWFAQFKEDRDGVARLLEVNARVGGSMTLTRLAGVNIPALALFAFAGFDVTVPPLRPDTIMTRHLLARGDLSDFSCVIWDLDDTLIRKDGKPDPEIVGRLLDLHNQGKRQRLLTRNVAPSSAMRAAFIPHVFERVDTTQDKVAMLRAWVDASEIAPSDTLMINDSFPENRALMSAFPELRVITPEATSVLAVERLS